MAFPLSATLCGQYFLQWVLSQASRSSSLGCPHHSHSVSILDALVLQNHFLRQKHASQLSHHPVSESGSHLYSLSNSRECRPQSPRALSWRTHSFLFHIQQQTASSGTLSGTKPSIETMFNSSYLQLPTTPPGWGQGRLLPKRTLQLTLEVGI